MITIEAYLYPPGWTGMRLGYGRLGVAALTAAPTDSGWFRLGVAALGAAPLGSIEPARTWQAVDAAQLASVRYTRGCSLNGVAVVARTGVLTPTWRDAGDPDTCPGLTAGTPVRLRDDVLGVLFTGRFYSARTASAKAPKATFTTWTINDAVREYSQANAGPFLFDLGYTDAQRAAQLVPAITIDPATGTNPLAGLVVATTSATMNVADYLDRTAAGGHGLWYIDAAGAAHYQRYRVEPTPAATYSDTDAPSYHDLKAAWGSGALVNDVVLKNVVADPLDSTKDVTTETHVTDPTSQATYGARRAELTTNIKATGITLLGVRYLAASTAAVCESITLRGTPPAVLEVGTAIDVLYRGKRMPARVLGIDAVLEPDREADNGTRWQLTYQTTPRPTA